MSRLPTSQQRALYEIEKTLAHDHPSLGPLFASFTTLVGHEAMPVTERVTAWPRRLLRWVSPTVATLVGLAVAAAVLLTISLMLPSPRLCPGPAIGVAAHRQSSVPTGRQ